MINGWDYAIRSMEVGERALIRVVDTENLGYGQQGVPPLIKPNQQLEFDITLLDCQPPTLNIDFDSIATLDNTPVRFILFFSFFIIVLADPSIVFQLDESYCSVLGIGEFHDKEEASSIFFFSLAHHIVPIVYSSSSSFFVRFSLLASL